MSSILSPSVVTSYIPDLSPTNHFFQPSQIFGKKDTHVPPEGRDLIRKTLHDAGVTFSFYEPAWAQHAFIRDELSKYVKPKIAPSV